MFKDFIGNLVIDNKEQIGLCYGEITASLNKKFRDTDSKYHNRLKVGSIGRHTAIKGVSDLDMLYIMPDGKWNNYKNGGQYNLLRDAKDAIKARYPKTKVCVDGLVVTVTYSNFHVELQPVFEQADGSFKYPHTENKGSWKTTKPREEIKAVAEFNRQKNKNLRRLCKMIRAWKNKHGVGMGGLLIDTLVYNFLKSTDEYDTESYYAYDLMSRDFFEYLKDQPKQDFYAALGSGQRVRVKKDFRRKAKKAYELCLKAIEAKGKDAAYDKWKKVYGRPFPSRPVMKNDALAFSEPTWRNTEEFIEDKFPIDIQFNIEIECDVSQNGHRKHVLSEFIRKGLRLQPKKELKFWLKGSDIAGKYDLYWKILNRGSEAERLDCIRGQIIEDQGSNVKTEHTQFRGEHIAECYAIRDGVVIAKDRIDVPID
ncbi:nucleotidyltransferase [Leptolyngbya sp. BC1307]|uniref:nucleotide-binding domain-containing protein n=1 Tax=Leptolyngbya sp. BC1307 TaxID=2029589 RepID=UPI000EFAFD49|nr:nucleotidyltransferase [Leptolyngbya sp. BC1307]